MNHLEVVVVHNVVAATVDIKANSRLHLKVK